MLRRGGNKKPPTARSAATEMMMTPEEQQQHLKAFLAWMAPVTLEHRLNKLAGIDVAGLAAAAGVDEAGVHTVVEHLDESASDAARVLAPAAGDAREVVAESLEGWRGRWAKGIATSPSSVDEALAALAEAALLGGDGDRAMRTFEMAASSLSATVARFPHRVKHASMREHMDPKIWDDYEAVLAAPRPRGATRAQWTGHAAYLAGALWAVRCRCDHFSEFGLHKVLRAVLEAMSAAVASGERPPGWFHQVGGKAPAGRRAPAKKKASAKKKRPT